MASILDALGPSSIICFKQESFPGGPVLKGGFQFEIETVVEERYSGENIISKYPVAKGTDRADNLYRLPRQVRISGYLRDAFFQGNPVSGQLTTALQSLNPLNGGYDATLAQAKTSLDACFSAPVTYQLSTTVAKLISSMALKKHSLVRNRNISNRFKLTLDLEELIIRADSEAVAQNAGPEYTS